MTTPTTNPIPDAPVVVLWHGTTRLRAEHILVHGPDPKWVVGGDAAYGLSTARPSGPFPLGDPRDYARGKALHFPAEGEAVILEVEVPQGIVDLAVQPGGEVWFGPGFGLEELLAAWPRLSVRILVP